MSPAGFDTCRSMLLVSAPTLMDARYDIPKSAPEPLRQVQLLINSVDLHNEDDWLPEWLDARGIAAGHRRAKQVREALRALVLANNGVSPQPRSLESARRAIARIPLAFDADGRLCVPHCADPLDEVVRIALAAMIDGSWERLKACPNCRWCFYDYSPNRSATWCSMQLCGNRKKTREYRRRTRSRKTS